MIEPYKKKALARLGRVRGQLDVVTKMVEDDKYCGDIITQILALQGAIKGIGSTIVESHLHTCGSKNLSSDNPKVKEKFIKEIIKVCELSGR